MKKRLWWWPGWVCGFGLLIGGGCESAPRAGEGAAGAATPVDLEAKQSLAAKFDSPLVILVVESGRSRADNNAMTIFGTPTFTGAAEGVTTAGLDIRNSRNRATVERFHLQRTPLLLCLSSRGIIISRDDREVTADLAAARARQALEQGPGLDEQFAALKEAARENPTNAGAQFHLTDFLMAHGNAAEAIPILAGLAHAEAAAPRDRIRAWVELGRAHLWIDETEKARNEARGLMDTLGGSSAEAKAGAEYLLGLHEAAAKRPAQAREHFEAAKAAAPNSAYARAAAAELRK